MTINSRINRFFSLLLAGAVFVAGGCIGDPYEVCPEEARVRIERDDARIWPPVVHTGFNGRDTFLAPISTNFVVDEWTTANVRTASVSGYPICGTPSISDPAGLVVAEGAGMTQVTARALDINDSPFTLNVDIVVESYTEEDTDLGEERYRTGEPAVADRIPCASCHEAAGGVDHTPLEMAYHDDAAILMATKDGKYPDFCTDALGVQCTCGEVGCDNVSPGYVLQGPHQWNLTPDEERAIVAFMRSLRPRGI